MKFHEDIFYQNYVTENCQNLGLGCQTCFALCALS